MPQKQQIQYMHKKTNDFYHQPKEKKRLKSLA